MEKGTKTTAQPIKKGHVIALIAIITCIISFGIHLFIINNKKEIESSRQNDIESIGELKIAQVSKWYHERITYPKVFIQSPFFIQGLKKWFGDKSNKVYKADVMKRLTLMNSDSTYHNILIADLKGNPLISINHEPGKIDQVDLEFIRKAAVSKKIVCTDFFPDKSTGKVNIDFIAPFVDADGKVIALLIMSVDPGMFLYPLLESWPSKSWSSEIILLRKDSAGATVLNNIRKSGSSALKVAFPFTQKDLSAIKAVSGYEGLYEGKDYKGDEVVGYIKPVPGTAWFLISKMDKNELYAGLYFRQNVILFVGILLIISAGALVVWIYLYRQSKAYKELLLKEKSLTESQREYKLLFESVPVGIYRTGLNGKIILANKALFTLLECRSNEELERISLEQDGSGPSYSRAKFRQEVMQKGEVNGIEAYWTLPNGKIKYIRENCRAFKDNNGKTLYFEGSLEDLTARANIEQTLRESEFFFKESQRAGFIGSIKIDISTGMWESSEVLDDILGIDSRFIKSTDNWLTLVHPEDREMLSRYLAEDVVEKKFAFNKEYRIIRRTDGSLRWVLGIGKLFLDEKMNKPILIGTIQDITERKTGDALREANLEIQAILSREGEIRDELVQIVNIIQNKLELECVGIRLKEGDDYPYFWSTGFPDSFVKLENSIIARDSLGGVCRNENGEISLECTCGLVISGMTDPSSALFTKGGSSWTNDSFPFLEVPAELDPRFQPRNNCIHYGYASVALIPIRAKNSIIGLIQLNDKRKGVFSLTTIELMETIAANIGEGILRKKAEQELIEYKDQLEKTVKIRTAELDKAVIKLKESLEIEKELNELKSRFIATASHEFRTPLTAILSSVELIKRHGESWTVEKKMQHLDRVINSVNYLTHLISDILDVDKYEAEKMQFNPVLISLKSLAGQVVEEIKLHIDGKHTIEFEYLSEQKDFLLDPKLMLSALRNLVFNAFKYSPRGGTINIKVTTDSEKLNISVSDEGIGIPEENLQRLFEPFYRGKNIEGIKGNGLGLTIVKNAVTLHNGTITVNSEPGKGTTFNVAIPLKFERKVI